MNKISLYIIIFSNVLFSCHKDHTVQGNTNKETYPVTFNVGFSQSIVPLNISKKHTTSALQTSATDTLSADVDVIYYYVYNSSRVNVLAIKQKGKSTGFGSLNTQLPAGTYSVSIIAGGENGFYPLDSLSNLLAAGNLQVPSDTTTYFGYRPDGSPVQGGRPWGDTFYKKFSITVSGSGSSYNVSLNRMVAQLQIHILDTIPAGATALLVKAHNECPFFDIKNDKLVDSYNINYNYLGTVPNASDIEMSVFVMNTTVPLDIEILCTGGTGGSTIYADKTITGVACKPNEITILTGKLFGGTTGNGIGFTPTYDPNWDPTPINYGF